MEHGAHLDRQGGREMQDTQRKLAAISSLLGEQTTLSLATTDEAGQACIAPLFYIADKELSLYWLSSRESLHSRNLLRNPRAAATIYRNTDRWREIRGIQMGGAVSEVTDPECRSAIIQDYCRRFKLGRVLRLAINQSTLYSFRPESIRSIDNARGFGFKCELERAGEGWILKRAKS